MTALEEILSERPPYDDGGAGSLNAAALETAKVRPAFFDVSCVAYRLMFAKASDYCRLSGTDDGKLACAVAADVMCDVADACSHFACGPVLCFDSARRIRKEAYPEYKEGRDRQKLTPEQERVIGLKGQIMRLLRTVFAPAYGVQGFCVNGYESDDVIASFVLGLKQSAFMSEPAYKRPVVVVTSDGDLHQLLIDGVHLADVRTGVLCDGADVEKHTGIRTADVVAAKCIGGCKSDHIGNVPGCGEVTVKEVLEKRNAGVSLKKAKDALESPEGEAVLRRNLSLVRLPYSGFPPLLLSAKMWPKQGVPDNVKAYLESAGIPSGDWPSFGDVTLPKPKGSIPTCAYKRKGVER